MAANGISTLATKQLRQVAKLDLAQAKRKGQTITEGGGTWSTDGVDDDTKNYYRSNNTYDLTSLPDIYNGNLPGIDDNPNPDGLIQKRPWIAVGAIANPGSIEEAVDGGSIADLQIWYDGADLSTYIPSASDEGQITQWTDKSNFAHNANPNGGSAKPTYENTTPQNGYGYIEFDGVDDSLKVSPFTNITSISGLTVFQVFQTKNITPPAGDTFLGTNDADFGILHLNGDMKLTMKGSSFDTAKSITANTWHQHTLIYDGTAPSLGYRLDKSAGTVTGGSVPSTSSANTDEMFFGNNVSGTSALDGFLAEVIIFTKTLNATEISNIENYLSNKWGI
jgi:hypothetical protein